jgi:hypothetical protein
MDEAPRRLLATMPMHAITATYGEEGLRERFAQEIAVFSDADRRRIEQALELASRSGSRGRTSTSSTATTWPPAWAAAPGRG